MLELIIGIIIGATFSDFWKHLFVQAKTWITNYMDKGDKDKES